MPEYQLQIKQVVDYPRCRIYREFIHKLINDRSIRINGGSGLFHFTVLCSYANFRTLLWSSIFVTLVAKKYHESVTLPSGLRMVYDNH